MLKLVHLDLTIHGPPQPLEKLVVGLRLKGLLVLNSVALLHFSTDRL